MRIVILMMVSLCFVMPLSAGDADPLLGLWATPPEDEGGQAHVEITGKGDGYSGRLVWLAEPVYDSDDEQGMGGMAKVDRENPDPALRSRPTQGLVILEGFVRSGNKWTDGTIYDPNNGKTYRCKMQLKGERLKVRGYIGVSLFGRSTEWTRVDD
ncbi:MAG: DUF2147 domain-containing protein [Acidobacteriota bacterium]